MYKISEKEISFFEEDGYLMVENFMDLNLIQTVSTRFEALFNGHFETSVPPDEWRWAAGRDPEHVTRMIWNGWKSDRTLAKLALHEKVGFYCAKLAGWSGTRLSQDGCIWKPPGAKGLAFHQDIQYNRWIVPNSMITCWIALDEAHVDNGGLEYAVGSHLWPMIEARPHDFHAPENHRAFIENVSQSLNKPLNIIVASLPPGGAVFHHNALWHGSGPNRSDLHRKALALHCMPDTAQFHPTEFAFAQGRYRLFNNTIMEESFYPILWNEQGLRSSFIDYYLSEEAPKLQHYHSHVFRNL